MKRAFNRVREGALLAQKEVFLLRHSLVHNLCVALCLVAEVTSRSLLFYHHIIAIGLRQIVYPVDLRFFAAGVNLHS